MLGLDSGTAAADSESEGIWAMMATARGERGRGARESGARYHLIRVIIGMEGNAHHTGWNGMEGEGNNAKTGEIRGRGRSGNCGTTTDTLFPQLVMMM